MVRRLKIFKPFSKLAINLNLSGWFFFTVGMADTTIGVSYKLKRELMKQKKKDEESFEKVIWRLLKEDGN